MLQMGSIRESLQNLHVDGGVGPTIFDVNVFAGGDEDGVRGFHLDRVRCIQVGSLDKPCETFLVPKVRGPVLPAAEQMQRLHELA